MGFLDSIKADRIGTKAYRTHVNAMQQRKDGKYAQSEAGLAAALAGYEEAYQLGLRKVKILHAHALLLMRKGEFERGRELLLEASKRPEATSDDKHSLRIEYALCQWKMGRLDKGVETARTAFAEKKEGSSYVTLGMLLVEQAQQSGNFDEALKFNLEALDYDDEDPAILDNLGQIHLALAKKGGEDAAQHRAAAKDFFRRAHDEKADQVSSNYYYAKMLHEDGEDDQARRILRATREIPLTALMQIQAPEIEALCKEVGLD